MNNDNYALVIDQSIAMREYVTLILQQGAHIQNVLKAESPEQALELLQKQQGTLSLIVSDADMPLKGFVSHLLTQPAFSKTALFLMSEGNNIDISTLANDTKAAAVLTKPFEAESLLDQFDKHVYNLDRRRAKRVVPMKNCMVDLGFDDCPDIYQAELINISESGILLRAPRPESGAGNIYDFASLVVKPVDSEVIRLFGHVVRTEASGAQESTDNTPVLMAFQFGKIDEVNMAKLQNYIVLNDTYDGSPAQRH